MSYLHEMDPLVQVAVIIERLDRLDDGLRDNREFHAKEIAEIKADVAEMAKDLKQNNATLNRARGGYLVILGLGGLLTYVTDIWGKVFALFMK